MRVGIEYSAASCPHPLPPPPAPTPWSLVSDEKLCRKHLKVAEGVPPRMWLAEVWGQEGRSQD